MASWTDGMPSARVYRIVGGRRHHNAIRKLRATMRRIEVALLLRAYGRTRGTQARIARELGGSATTICRDVERLLDQARLL